MPRPTARPIAPCKHCTSTRLAAGLLPRLGKRRRGLCFDCYLDRDIRDRYPKLQTHLDNTNAIRDFEGDAGASLPGTDALPGTDGKLEALSRRVLAARDPWSDDDAEADDSGARILASHPLAQMSFQARLRILIRRTGLTMDGFAGKAGVARAVVFRLTSGGHQPTLRTLRKLAEALKVEVSFLLDGK